MITGAVKSLKLAGLARNISSDNDPNFTKGGRYITEKQEATEESVYLVDKKTGVLSGVEERVAHADGTFASLDEAMQKCADGDPVSCLIEMADGQKYTAAGGVMIIPDNPDGMMTIREGKFQYSLHPEGGRWIPA